MKAHNAIEDECKPFEGDRYERLRQGAEVLAADPGLTGGAPPYNAEGLIAFAESVTQLRLLDGLSETDCNAVIMLVCLDFTRGPERMVWRIHDLMTTGAHTPVREYDDDAAVIHTLLEIVTMVVGAWLPPDPWLTLNRLAADIHDAYETFKEEPGSAGEYLLAAIDCIDDAVGALPQ